MKFATPGSIAPLLLQIFTQKVVPVIKTQKKESVKFGYEKVQALEKNLNKYKISQTEYSNRLALLKDQSKELEEIKLSDKDELNSLQKEYERLSHSVELENFSHQIFELLYQNDNEISAVVDYLSTIETLFIKMMEYDESVEPLLEMLRSASTQVIEIGQEINKYGYSLDTDPQRLRELENRIHLIKQFCRKYLFCA